MGKSVFDRYNIVSEDDLRDGIRRIEAEILDTIWTHGW